MHQEPPPPQLLPQRARLQFALPYERRVGEPGIKEIRALTRPGVGDVVEGRAVSDQVDGFGDG